MIKLYESVELPLELQVHLEQWRDFLKRTSKVWLVLKSLANRIFQLPVRTPAPQTHRWLSAAPKCCEDMPQSRSVVSVTVHDAFRRNINDINMLQRPHFFLIPFLRHLGAWTSNLEDHELVCQIHEFSTLNRTQPTANSPHVGATA